MAQYGTTPEQLAEVAVAARQWAMRNPAATRREPMSVADVLASPMVASPLHLRDCCLVTDGAGALIVTSLRRARDLRQPLVQVLGIAEGSTHHFTPFAAMDWLVTGNASSGERAFAMAQVKHADLDVVEIYDSFTITVLQTLEDLGFCGRGEGGAFVSGGRIAPGGDLPLNTSGGGLSYCHPGMFGTFVAIEGVRQLRGECGERQVPDAKLALCHGTGGVFSTQATMIIARD
jgi:acetyl-CoA C-acetyltransferase